MWNHTVTDVFGDEHELNLQYLVLWSDPHLNHRPHPKTGEGGILKYGRGNRWLTVEAMNNALLDGLYEALQRRTTEKSKRQLLVTGDVVMGLREEGLPLVGEVIRDAGVEAFLVPGNHDNSWPGHKRHEEWQQKYRDLGALVCLPVELNFPTRIGDVTVCHFPFAELDGEMGDHTGELRYAEWRPFDKGQFLIHGHLHGTRGKRTSATSVDVGVDAWDYKPVMFRDVLKFLEGNES